MFRSKSPGNLFRLILESNNPYASQSVINGQIPFFNVKTNFLKNSFLPAVTTKWNNIDINICNSSPCHMIKSLVLKFIRPIPKRISSTQNFQGLKLLTRMRLGLSHLADHKFRHNFQDCLNPICSCGKKIETTSHSFFTVSITVVQENNFLKKSISLILIFYSKITFLQLRFTFWQ